MNHLASAAIQSQALPPVATLEPAFTGLEGTSGEHDIRHATPPQWLQDARAIVEARFLETLRLAEISSAVGVHFVHLSRQFRRYYDCTVGDLIRRRRVEYACHLLLNSDISLAEIALTCCFSDQSHFSMTFKRQIGTTPSKFRARAANNRCAERKTA